MDGDLVDFAPERSQLARTTPPGEPAAPPAWVAVLAVAGALGISLSLALPPVARVHDGAITRRSAADVTPPVPSDLLQSKASSADP